MSITTRMRATQALRRHAPELADAPVEELGRGLDNTAFVAADLVLRVAEDRSVQREAGLLEFLAPRLPIPIPRPRLRRLRRARLSSAAGTPLAGR